MDITMIQMMEALTNAKNKTKLSDIVKGKRGFVLVDTCYTIDHGWETMVFECDERGNVTDWGDLDCEIYSSEEEAKAGHSEIVKRWAA